MALTPEHIQALTKPFSVNDHEFIRGYVYISELAVTTRLDEIDPSWTFEVLNNVQRDKQMVATARLTVHGIARDGVGMYSMEYLSDTNKETGEKTYRTDAAGNLIDAGEAEKSSVTDALRRCARLFGVGRYLLDNPPKASSDQRAFDSWLARQQKDHAAKWRYELTPKKADDDPPPPPPSSPTPPTKAEQPDLVVVERTDIAPRDDEPMARVAGAEKLTPEQVEEAKRKLGNKHSIDANRKPARGKQSEGIGPAFAQWTKKHKIDQAEALAAMNVKYLSEWAGSRDEMLDLLRNHFHTADEGGES